MRCEEQVRVPGPWPRYRQCSREATHGKFCKQHSEEAKAAREKQQQADYEEHLNKMRRRHDCLVACEGIEDVKQIRKLVDEVQKFVFSIEDDTWSSPGMRMERFAREFRKILAAMKKSAPLILLLALLGPSANAATVTAYCPCRKCCGRTGAPTASGKLPVEGVTVAAPRSVPLGTRVFIEGVGWRVAQDRTARRFDGRWDVFYNNHGTAQRFGKRKLKIWAK